MLCGNTWLCNVWGKKKNVPMQFIFYFLGHSVCAFTMFKGWFTSCHRADLRACCFSEKLTWVWLSFMSLMEHMEKRSAFLISPPALETECTLSFLLTEAQHTVVVRDFIAEVTRLILHLSALFNHIILMIIHTVFVTSVWNSTPGNHTGNWLHSIWLIFFTY